MRLIDVDKLFKTLNKLEIPFYADINNAINSQPTAYNVDKVVEQLEEKSYYIFGRRKTGYFDIRDLQGNKVNKGSINYKKLNFIEPSKKYLQEIRFYN